MQGVVVYCCIVWEKLGVLSAQTSELVYKSNPFPIMLYFGLSVIHVAQHDRTPIYVKALCICTVLNEYCIYIYKSNWGLFFRRNFLVRGLHKYA